MTLTLLCSTAEESLKIERQIIQADNTVEVYNPYHEEPVIYASRMPDPDNMVKRTITRLIVTSDFVLNLSGQTWMDDICKILSIPIYHELSDILREPDSDSDDQTVEPDLYEEEVWCAGCEFSGMNPRQVSDVTCEKIGCDCPFFSSFDDSVNNKNSFNIDLYDPATMYGLPTKAVYKNRVRMAYGENNEPEDVA